MHPTICRIGPFTIYSYGLMLAVAFLSALFLVNAQARREKLESEKITNFLFLSFICGIIGARLFFILENLNYYFRNPWETLLLQRGGLSWFGGLILGGGLGIVYLRKNNLAVYKILDLVSPYLALAQAIGRIGCFLNGCCFGKPQAGGIYFPLHQARLIPTQIYSSLGLIGIFLVLRWLRNRQHLPGEIFLVYLILYSLKRFLIEFLRQDNPQVFWGLTLFQLLSIALFFISGSALLRLKKPPQA